MFSLTHKQCVGWGNPDKPRACATPGSPHKADGRCVRCHSRHQTYLAALDSLEGRPATPATAAPPTQQAAAPKKRWSRNHDACQGYTDRAGQHHDCPTPDAPHASDGRCIGCAHQQIKEAEIAAQQAEPPTPAPVVEPVAEPVAAAASAPEPLPVASAAPVEATPTLPPVEQATPDAPAPPVLRAKHAQTVIVVRFVCPNCGTVLTDPANGKQQWKTSGAAPRTELACLTTPTGERGCGARWAITADSLPKDAQ